MIVENNKKPIQINHRIQECDFEHNFGCWGKLFIADFKNQKNETITRTCCEAHKNNPRLTQGQNINFGTKSTEWKLK